MNSEWLHLLLHILVLAVTLRRGVVVENAFDDDLLTNIQLLSC